MLIAKAFQDTRHKLLTAKEQCGMKISCLQKIKRACLYSYLIRYQIIRHVVFTKPFVPVFDHYIYTHICRIKGCGGAGWPPTPIIFERLKLPQQIIYRRKENLSESPNHQKYWENILVSRFYEQFSRNRRNLGHFRKFEKISNSQNMNILYIILKHVIWRFQIYNLFREIFKFREDKSNNVFREIRKCFRKTAKFEFFAKQIIYLESPDHLLQNDI